LHSQEKKEKKRWTKGRSDLRQGKRKNIRSISKRGTRPPTAEEKKKMAGELAAEFDGRNLKGETRPYGKKEKGGGVCDYQHKITRAELSQESV